MVSMTAPLVSEASLIQTTQQPMCITISQQPVDVYSSSDDQSTLKPSGSVMYRAEPLQHRGALKVMTSNFTPSV